jgi:hypothetical protein
MIEAAQLIVLIIIAYNLYAIENRIAELVYDRLSHKDDNKDALLWEDQDHWDSLDIKDSMKR